MKKQSTKLPQQDKLDITCTITLTTRPDWPKPPVKKKYKGLVTEGKFYKIVAATMENGVLQEFVTPWRQLPGDAIVEKVDEPYTYVIANSDASVK